MKMRSIASYLPDRSAKNTFIAVRVPDWLAQEIKRVAKERGWRASDIVRAGLTKFLDDQKGKK